MLFSYKDRIIKEALYICNNKATVRACAKEFGLSKSCIHKDMQEKLVLIDIGLYEKVKKVFNENYAQKHIRGGVATKNKYLNRSK